MPQSVAILGGGVTGLSLALRLAQENPSIQIVVFEKERTAGGLARNIVYENWTVERFYHHIFLTDATYLKLLEEVGLGASIRWLRSTVGFISKGEIYPMNSIKDLLSFRPLSIIDRIRLGVGIAKIKYLPDFSTQLHNLDAKEWLSSFFSPAIYEKMYEPLLKAKFGMDISDASAAFVYGRLRARMTTRKTAQEEVLGYLERGSERFIDKLLQKLKQLPNVTIRTGSDLTKVEQAKGKWTIFFATKKKEEFDLLTATLPIPVFRSLVHDAVLKQSGLDSLHTISYQGVICAVAVCTKQLTPYYWNNILDEEIVFRGIIEHTNFVDKKKYNNRHLAYLFNYLNAGHELWQLSDEQISQKYKQDLLKLFPSLTGEDVLDIIISRAQFATPRFTKEYIATIPPIKTKAKNLYLVGSFQVYPYSRNINKCIELAFDAARIITNDLKGV